MGGFASIARGALAGLNEAAGNQQTAAVLNDRNKQDQEAKHAQLRAQIVPHALAIKGLQTKLSSLDPNDPHYHDEQALLTNEISRNLAEVRGLIYPDKDPKGNFFERGVTDKLHLSSLKRREALQKMRQQQGQAQDESSAKAITEGTVPYTQDPKFVESQALENQRSDAAQTLETQKATAAQALEAEKLKNSLTKASAEPKPLEAGGVPYGVSDPTTGKQYLASQMASPDTPPNIKEIWNTVKDAQTAKKAEADKKDEERDKRFLQSQAAIANRMGRSEEFQVQMAGYREQLGNFKTIDAQADKTKTLADTYEAQYKDPATNKSAVDTALLTDYTSVLAQGGRKTQAEINMARNIGSFRLNWEQKLKKATTGELPDELRKMYLNYIKAAAKTQREDADKLKPQPPEVTVHQGTKTKSLKSSRGAQDLNKALDDAMAGH